METQLEMMVEQSAVCTPVHHQHRYYSAFPNFHTAYLQQYSTAQKVNCGRDDCLAEGISVHIHVPDGWKSAWFFVHGVIEIAAPIVHVMISLA